MSHEAFPAPTDASLERIRDWTARSNMLQWLNFGVDLDEDRLRFKLSFDEHHIGNEFIRALHGGVVSSFLQTCATAEIIGRAGTDCVISTISVHCDFLRPAKGKDMFGDAVIVQHGRRIAFVEVTGWQSSPDKPVAKADIALRLSEDGTH